MKLARYPGVRPFETFQKDYFFGREHDVADLFDLVMLQKMVVVFARSGYGKSSLINAGLIPRLQSANTETENHYIPLVVRPGSYVEGQAMMPLEERLRHELTQKAPVISAPFLDTLCEQKTLWYYFKQRHAHNQERFVLIFDQFEEFFTHPQEQQQRFNAQLAELLYESIPQDVRRAAGLGGAKHLDFLAMPMDIKAMFVIRGDRLSLLDRMKTQLPAIFSNRFELKALSRMQAKAAIVQPAKLPENILCDGEKIEFNSPSFEYDKVALEQILHKLSEGRSSQEARIEAFQLQIVCTWIEEEVRAGRISDRDGNGMPDVMPEDLPDFAKIFESYYNQQLEKLTPDDQKVARMVIEDELLYVNSVTGEGRRLSVDKDVLLDDYILEGLSDPLLQRLEDTFLLRREPNTMGGYSFEISHDALIEPISKARKERLEEQEAKRLKAEQEAEQTRREKADKAEQERKEVERRTREAEEKAQMEAAHRVQAERLHREAEEQRHLAETRRLEAEEQRHLAETQKESANEQRFLAEKSRKRALNFFFIAVCLASVSIILGVRAWQNAKIADERRKEVERVIEELDYIEFKQFITDGDELFTGKYFASSLEFYMKADTLLQKHFENQNFRQAGNNLSDKIRLCQIELQKQ